MNSNPEVATIINENKNTKITRRMSFKCPQMIVENRLYSVAT